ncbi:MAG: maleylpyruvate isomerase N-terminal domain-containing protein, partial [Dehalococcoidia bacterium]
FQETVLRVRPEQWDQPGLGVWDIRDLVGHTHRALLTAEEYAAAPAQTVEVHTPADYYHRALAAPDIDERVAERGREAGAGLGADPAITVQATVARAVPAVNSIPTNAIIAVPVGAMRLTDYLVTRVLELMVHSFDIANATGQNARPPRDALAATLHLLADLAVDSGHGAELALLATGRGTVADRFSVLG